MGEIVRQIKVGKFIESAGFLHLFKWSHVECLNITAILENINREKKSRL